MRLAELTSALASCKAEGCRELEDTPQQDASAVRPSRCWRRQRPRAARLRSYRSCDHDQARGCGSPEHEAPGRPRSTAADVTPSHPEHQGVAGMNLSDPIGIVTAERTAGAEREPDSRMELAHDVDQLGTAPRL